MALCIEVDMEEAMDLL